MAVQMSSLVMSALGELRVHPITKWIRASSGGETVVSSTRALIVWEPRRVVPSYAVPVTDVMAQLVPASVPMGVANPFSCAPVVHRCSLPVPRSQYTAAQGRR